MNSFSQIERQIHCKIIFNNIALEKIDIVNLNSKITSTTDANGKFTILAKVGDVLFILSKDYYDIKITLKQDDFTREKLIINLDKKPLELEEVTIINANKVGYKVSFDEIAMGKLSKYENSPKVIGVYTGEMPYGMDFVGIFKKIFGSKKKENKAEVARFKNFKEYAVSKFDINAHFHKNLNLKPEEVDLFMAFCESDSKCKIIMKNENILETMEFLEIKKTEFKKLER